MPLQPSTEIHLATTPESIERCFAVMRELRPALTGTEEFVPRVQQQERRKAHAFYFRERMRVSSFHFMLPLK
jgi:hypothetical protein